ncbi:hypothetical protein CALCODRAFT_503711 [Calocera cornea HHB12733]|uniref:Uncharacterized protein n=1 Tax=Calocera cornea HHB12733 TaxID=1353952 RepID=A0A165CS10_9BASI|nr:hypothetical protein CALCODRAFT_503711 [Calocera cornea HHB12733]
MWLSIRSAPCSALCWSRFPARNTPYKLSNAAANWRISLQPIHPLRLFSDDASIVTSWACDALLNPERSAVRPAQTILAALCSTLACMHRVRHL